MDEIFEWQQHTSRIFENYLLNNRKGNKGIGPSTGFLSQQERCYISKVYTELKRDAICTNSKGMKIVVFT